MAKKDSGALFQNGDPDFRGSRRTDDPYERGFADCLYDNDFEDDDMREETDDLENEDYDAEYDDYEAEDDVPIRSRPRKKHRFLRAVGRLLLIIVLIVTLLLAVVHFMGKAPIDGAMHKDESVTILLAGTDASGDQTDTLMLLNLDRGERRISVMSIPRDTKVNSTYWPHKINGAYAANGHGAEGMDALMDYVADCVGFRPDGYVLLDLDVFVELVDLFGGVDFDVPQDMFYEDPTQGLYIDLQAGEQHLNGEQTMGLVRYRSGYAMADLRRVEVQREVLRAAVEQWCSPMKLIAALRALPLLEEATQTDLSARELIWLAESAALCGTDDLQMLTMPYYLNDIYVCVDADEEYLNRINTYFNPYETEIGYGDLNIAY